MTPVAPVPLPVSVAGPLSMEPVRDASELFKAV